MNEYNKLRPWTDIQYCDCQEIKGIILVYTLTDNPIHCYECKGVIDPETLKLTGKVTSEVASWHNTFSSLYNLWLDSGDYEEWAKEQLKKKDGQVNQKGIAVAKEMSKLIPTYYWWWHDPDEPDLQTCPNCNSELEEDNRHGSGKCQSCCIVA